MVRGYSQGCHRCGGYPGHKSKDRAYLVECIECGTITCNEHIPISGGCPECGSHKTRKVMTRADVKKRRKGSKVQGVTAGQRGGTSQVDMGEEDNQQRPFAGGGFEFPFKKNTSEPTLPKQPNTDKAQDARRVQDRMQQLLGTENSNSQMPHSIPDVPKRGGENEQSITGSLSEDSFPQGTKKDKGDAPNNSSHSQHEAPHKNEGSATNNEEVRSSQLIQSSSDLAQSPLVASHVSETSDGQKVYMTSSSVSDQKNLQDNESLTHQQNQQMPSITFSKSENYDPAHSTTMHQAAEVDEDSDNLMSKAHEGEQGDGSQQTPKPTFLITSPTQGVNQFMPGVPGSLQEGGKPTIHQAAEVDEDSDDPLTQVHAREQGDGSQQTPQPTLLIISPAQGVNQLTPDAPGSLQEGGKPTMHQAAELDEDSVNSVTMSQTQLGKMPATYKQKTQYEIDMEDFDADVDDLFDNGFLGRGNVMLHSGSTHNAENKELGKKYNPPNFADPNDFSQQSEEDIEREFQELEEARKKDLSQSNNIEFMKELAQKDRHQISASIHLADAFWGLKGKGLDGVKDSLNYAQSIEKLHRKSKQSYENPDVMMSVLLYEPTTNDMSFDIKALKQIAELPRIESSIGFGPRSASRIDPDRACDYLNDIVEQNVAPIALGLMGLDNHYSPYTMNAQQALLNKQLEFAFENDYPVYLTAHKAANILAESLEALCPKSGHHFIMTDLIQSQEMLELVNRFDMHVCLRPELTQDSQKEALARTAQVNPTRWLLCGAYNHSAPKGKETLWNKPEYLPQTATQIGDLIKRTDEDLRTLCTGNLARLFFGNPWYSEKGKKEDIWSEFR